MNLEKSMRYLPKQFFRIDKQYTMLQNSQQSTDIIIPKTSHTHYHDPDECMQGHTEIW